MPTPRGLLAGVTDYTAVSLEDIVQHLKEWLSNTADAIAALRKSVLLAEQKADILPRDIIPTFLNPWMKLFESYHAEFQRLIEELPRGVRRSHVNAVRQLYKRSQAEELACQYFIDSYMKEFRKNDEARQLAERIDREARNQFIDYRDLNGVAGRLHALVGTTIQEQPSSSQADGKKLIGGLTVVRRAVYEDFKRGGRYAGDLNKAVFRLQESGHKITDRLQDRIEEKFKKRPETWRDAARIGPAIFKRWLHDGQFSPFFPTPLFGRNTKITKVQ
ncbi:MAG: hypothetical protein HY644_01640 [Acidobacteria bacterium]|nr:hypothetical protein [Acidobacteriota bacterium]